MSDRPTTKPRPATDALREVRERMTAAAAGSRFGYHEAMQCVEVVEASIEAEAAQGAAPGEYTIDDGERSWKFEGAAPRAEGLDAATLERCARLAEDHAERLKHTSHRNGLGMGWLAGEELCHDLAFRIRSLSHPSDD